MESNKEECQFRATAPYFMVRSLKASLDYYHNVLGFDMPPLWGEPPSFAMPSRDRFIIMLKEVKQGAEITTNRSQGGYWDAYVWINDADALFTDYKEKGAIVDYEPCIRPEYDMKEFGVRDSDGHVIGFGQHYQGGT